ncbi:MAG TPA: aminodeoxychorismate synthase component I, partial [Longimicrobiales bacterium]|nr:aminodeoxychorismate synthase component I [Longimicrobiales bacterium]
SAAWTPSCDAALHGAAVRDIREAIARGDVYQVNHTVRFAAEAGTGDDARADRIRYERLRRAQPHALAAYLDLGAWRVLSASPELFFRRRGDTIETRPMKGTRRRGRWAAEDEALAAELAASEKDRAENLMIVDLLRNDLGRIARTGTVRVPALFAVERYRTVWQMTSTIAADIPESCGLDDVFRALFPCGSVTGAPKIAAMKFIARLESAPREVYCGAIGFVEPGGDATFSVAIRTAWRDVARGTLEYGAGGGITWDSDPAAEWQEVLAKTAILTWRPAPFRLLETMRAERGAIVRLDRHLERLLASGTFLGIEVDVDAVRAALQEVAAAATAPVRVRLLVGGARNIEVQSAALTPLVPPVSVALARTPVDSRDPFLCHKTTQRDAYDQRMAEHPGRFDVALVNERGELTEFTRGNIVLELRGERLTPARECGLLDGVFRRTLLERGDVREAVLTPADLAAAPRIWLINSVREWVPAQVVR